MAEKIRTCCALLNFRRCQKNFVSTTHRRLLYRPYLHAKVGFGCDFMKIMKISGQRVLIFSSKYFFFVSDAGSGCPVFQLDASLLMCGQQQL